MVSTETRRAQMNPGAKMVPPVGRTGGKTEEHGLKKVFICSPLHPMGDTREERERDWKRNISLAKQACRYAVEKGYVPYAPHLYFPQFLSEDDPAEREMGIIMGLSWLLRCDEVWVCGLRISEGMSREIAKAKEWNKPLKAYVPIPGAENRVFDADFITEEEFFRTLSDDMEGDAENEGTEGNDHRGTGRGD